MLEQFSLKCRVALVTGSSQGLGWAMAEALAGAGAHVVDEDIRRLDQPVQRVPRLGLLQIDRKAALVAVHRHEDGRVAMPLRRQRTSVVAVRRSLDLDDVRAHVAEQHAAKRAGDQIAELEYSDTFKWLRQRVCSPERQRSTRMLLCQARPVHIRSRLLLDR